MSATKKHNMNAIKIYLPSASHELVTLPRKKTYPRIVDP